MHKVRAKQSLRRTGFHVRSACVFMLLIVAVISVSLLGMRGQAPAVVVVAVILFTAWLTWLAVSREWQAVRQLAQAVGRWEGGPPDTTSPDLDSLSRSTDPDVAALAGGVHALAARIADSARREHQFTRDVSHELRSPLTVVKISVDRLLDSPQLGTEDLRAARNIRQASLELEIMVEALLALARGPDLQVGEERFVANEVVRGVVADARERLSDRPVELHLEESARFALEGSARGFAVLCGQLIRNAYQQTDSGLIEIHLSPQMFSVSNTVALPVAQATRSHRARAASRHGFELSIAHRISDRFAWPMELDNEGDESRNVARISFPRWFPPESVDAPLRKNRVTVAN
jgi:signal transduction histidine kinase